jgi:hypothetical protein
MATMANNLMNSEVEPSTPLFVSLLIIFSSIVIYPNLRRFLERVLDTGVIPGVPVAGFGDPTRVANCPNKERGSTVRQNISFFFNT